jgi:inner membrane protein
MTNRTHDAIAFASLSTIAAIYPPENLNLLTLVGSVVACDIGAMLPDIDDAGNKLWDLLPQGKSVAKILRRIFYKHRTLTHSLFGLFGVYKFFQWLLPKFLNPNFVNPNIIIVSLMIGYISHLIGDALTKEGLPLLFPLKISFGFPPVKKMRVRTGKWFENFVVFPSVWVYLLWFISSNQGRFLQILDKLNK